MKKKRMFLTGFLFICAFFIFLGIIFLFKNNTIQIGLTFLQIGGVLFILFVFVYLTIWRCKKCGEFLGHIDKKQYCDKCGEKLN